MSLTSSGREGAMLQEGLSLCQEPTGGLCPEEAVRAFGRPGYRPWSQTTG